MKKILLIALFCLGCEQRVSKDLETDTHGHVNINGKDCEVVTIGTGNGGSRVYFIDCGPGSSSVSYHAGKISQSAGQYTPPTSGVCHCPDTQKVNDIKKILDN